MDYTQLYPIGFLYVGTLLHDLIHLTQYIAPLQANFNPSLNDTARILVYNSGLTICESCDMITSPVDTRFTVQWDQVHNHDHVQG